MLLFVIFERMWVYLCLYVCVQCALSHQVIVFTIVASSVEKLAIGSSERECGTESKCVNGMHTTAFGQSLCDDWWFEMLKTSIQKPVIFHLHTPAHTHTSIHIHSLSLCVGRSAVSPHNATVSIKPLQSETIQMQMLQFTKLLLKQQINYVVFFSALLISGAWPKRSDVAFFFRRDWVGAVRCGAVAICLYMYILFCLLVVRMQKRQRDAFAGMHL